MSEQYSIAAARHNLAALVRKLEKQPLIQITRRGKTVAVLLSLQEYERLGAERSGFWRAYSNFLQAVNLEELKIEPEVFEDVRSREPGRGVEL